MKTRVVLFLLIAFLAFGCKKEELTLQQGNINIDIEEPLSSRITEIEFIKTQFSNTIKRRVIFENDSLAKALYSKITLIMEDNSMIEFEPEYLNGEIVRLLNKSQANSDIELSYIYDASKSLRKVSEIKSYSSYFPFALDFSYSESQLQYLNISQLNTITKQHSNINRPWYSKFCLSDLEDNCNEADLVKYQITHHTNPFYASNSWLAILLVLNYNTKIEVEQGLQYRSEGFEWTIPFYTKKKLPYSISDENYKYSYDIAFQNDDRLEAIHYTPLSVSVEYSPSYSIIFKYRE